jgi:hypothetical protein
MLSMELAWDALRLALSSQSHLSIDEMERIDDLLISSHV